MNKLLFTIAAVFGCITISQAADRVYIENFDIKIGESKQVDIMMSNPDAEYRDLQFDLYLPDGVTIVTDEDDEYMVEMSSRCTNKHTYGISYIAGHYRFLLYSTSKKALTGNSGAIFTITVKAQANATVGTVDGFIRDVKLSTPDGTGPSYSEFKYSVTIKGDEPQVTITADDIKMTYGDEVPKLTYTVTGGTLYGTPSLTTYADKTSDVGEYTIVCAKGTVTNPNVKFNDGTLTINKAPLTIRIHDVTITEGEAIPQFQVTYDGFKNNDSEASVFTTLPVATTSATSNSPAGTYTITLSAANPKNYYVNIITGTLTIEKKKEAPVVVRADNKEMTYGDEVPTLTYSKTGGTLNGTPELTTQATSLSDVGTYTITASKGTVTNSDVTYYDGQLTIKKAPLTIRVHDVTITEGDAIPQFQVTYEGFKNNDSEASVFATLPVATTSATSNSPAGTYTITLSPTNPKNYDVTIETGTLTILSNNEPFEMLWEGNDTLYLYNIEKGMFLNSGNSWGTHAILNQKGLPLRVSRMSDSDTWHIFFYEGSRSQQLLFCDTNGEGAGHVWVDYNNSGSPDWTIIASDQYGSYYIQNPGWDENTYLGNMSNGTDYNFQTHTELPSNVDVRMVAEQEFNQWKFLTPEEYRELIAQRESENNIVDETDFTNWTRTFTTEGTNGSFSLNTWSVEQDESGIQTPFIETWVNAGWGTPLSPMTIDYRPVTGLEPGAYRVTLTMRAYNEYAGSPTPSGVRLVANDNSVDISTGNVFTYNGNTGIWDNYSVVAIVGDDGQLSISVDVYEPNLTWLAMKGLTVEPTAMPVEMGDISYMIVNNAFDYDLSEWESEGGYVAFGGKGDNGNNVIGDVARIEDSGNAEVYHSAFDCYQILHNMPVGNYTLTLQAFERNDLGWEEYWSQGPQAGINAVLYANDNEVKINSIMTGASDVQIYQTLDENGNEIWTSDSYTATYNKYVPNSMDGANFYFHLSPETYLVTLNFTVEEEGSDVRLGIKNDSGMSWVIFDNFHLYYNGQQMSDPTDVNGDGVVDTQDVLQIYSAIQESVSSDSSRREDVNHDGNIDTQDVLEVYDHIQKN